MGKCYNSTVIDVPIEEVWEMIKDFHQLSWGDEVITKVDIVGEVSGTEVGAKRILNEAFHETLLSVDDGPGPVSKDSVQK